MAFADEFAIAKSEIEEAGCPDMEKDMEKDMEQDVAAFARLLSKEAKKDSAVMN